MKDLYIQNNSPYIIQDYIKNPLLVRNTKFDFRVYVLVKSLDPFIVFVSKTNMARFCIEEYVNPKNKKDMKNIYG